MRQTAVDFLIETLLSYDEYPNSFYDIIVPEIIEEAKEKEMLQIMEAHRQASLEAGFEYSADDWADEYYKKTYEQ